MARRPDPKDSKWMRYIRRRGFEAERELVRGLRQFGVLAWRIPASGMYESRKKMSLPDVLAYAKGEFWGFQVKATAKDHVRVWKKQLEPLQAWLLDVLEHDVAGRAWIAVKFSGGFWVLREFDGELRNYDFSVKSATRLKHQLAVLLGVQDVLG